MVTACPNTIAKIVSHLPHRVITTFFLRGQPQWSKILAILTHVSRVLSQGSSKAGLLGLTRSLSKVSSCPGSRCYEWSRDARLLSPTLWIGDPWATSPALAYIFAGSQLKRNHCESSQPRFHTNRHDKRTSWGQVISCAISVWMVQAKLVSNMQILVLLLEGGKRY